MQLIAGQRRTIIVLTAVLLAVLLAGCSTSAGSATGAYGTWLWNGSGWTHISSVDPGGKLAYWKDLGGLISWNGLRWNGINWVKNAAVLPGSPPGSGSRLEDTILDEASDQLVYMNADSQTIAVWSGKDWKTVPVVWPDSRYLFGAGYDPAERGILVIMCCVGGIGQTWLWNGSGLVRLTPDSPITTAATRGSYYLVPDGEGHMIAIGAESQGAFMWDGRTWHSLGQNSTLPEMSAHGVVFNESQGQINAFGLQDSTGTWAVSVWLLQNGTWKLIQPTVSPPTDTGCGVGLAVYDPELAGVALTDSNEACVGALP